MVTKVRLSTTVDQDLLARARALQVGPTDASMLEAALLALIRAHRATEIDDAYERAYTRLPVGTEDGWGDLEAFLDEAART